uniref:Secreted protein n=1 Tax=Triticum urartu TaxID=4572 RepID=A0A8R7PFK1_TRIUA
MACALTLPFISMLCVCRIQGLIFRRLSSVVPALTQGPSWVEFTLIEEARLKKSCWIIDVSCQMRQLYLSHMLIVKTMCFRIIQCLPWK